MKLKNTPERAFLSYLLKYVGVGLISGSIIHISTLGGSPVGYAVLITSGVAFFIIGTLLEESAAVTTTSYIAISVLLSISIGMVSGGTQHFTDGALYASRLIPIGLFLGYITFVFREDKKLLTLKKISWALICSLALFGALNKIAHTVPTSDNYHNEEDSAHS